MTSESGSPTDAAERPALQVIQTGRGIAALLVVLFHATSIAEFYLHHTFAAGLFLFGYGGVDVFFVLSGLVMVWAHGHDVGRPARLRQYLTRRFIRIYPVFWIVAALLLPVYFGLPRDANELGSLFRSLLLLNPTDNQVVTVAWSLTFEIYFYAMFGLAIGLPWSVARTVYCIWLPLSAVSYIAALATNGRLLDPSWAAFWLSPYSLEFALGCAAGYALRIGVASSRLLAPTGAVLFMASGLSEAVLHRYFGQRHSIVSYGLMSALLAMGAVQWEQQTPRRLPRVLLLLGDASYSIFLTHYALLDLLARAALRSGLAPLLGPAASIVLIIVLTIGIGIMFHHYVERPSLSYLRHKIGGGQLALPVALGLIVVTALAIAGHGYRDFWISYDILPDYENAANFVDRGWLPIKGSLSGLGAYNPPGFSWLYIPGVILFPGHPGAAEFLGSAILFCGTVIALRRLLGTDIGSATTIGTVAIFAFSSIGMFYASSLWPRAHVFFYAWTVYHLKEWALNRRPNACASAVAAYLLGLYCFFEIAPLGLLFPIVFAIYRPPIGRLALLACVAIMALVWSPYLGYEMNRSGVDVWSFVTGANALNATDLSASSPERLVDMSGAWSTVISGLMGNYLRGLRPLGGVVLFLAGAAALAFASMGGRRLITRLFGFENAQLPPPALRLHRFLGLCLIVPWTLMLLLVLRESLDPSRRFFWFWLLQAYFIGFFAFWMLPRLRLRRSLIMAGQALLILAVLPLSVLRQGIADVRHSGYGGASERMAAVDAVAASLAAQGRKTARIGYEVAIPAWQRRADGHFIFKVGNDYDLVFRRRHAIENTDQADAGFAPDDEYRIVELVSDDAFRDVAMRSTDRHRFTEIARHGNYWVGRRADASP